MRDHAQTVEPTQAFDEAYDLTAEALLYLLERRGQAIPDREQDRGEAGLQIEAQRDRDQTHAQRVINDGLAAREQLVAIERQRKIEGFANRLPGRARQAFRELIERRHGAKRVGKRMSDLNHAVIITHGWPLYAGC